jgi:hypothetical protein
VLVVNKRSTFWRSSLFPSPGNGEMGWDGMGWDGLGWGGLGWVDLSYFASDN